ncbi:hypothetical protein BJ165DRAFT_1505543 [Panaeolus papilionaceus]|nr:hypothetical protein BJ165DRAFT_1505543 [Panaeolus papilionaceus]
MQLFNAFALRVIMMANAILYASAGGGFSATCSNIQLSQDHFLSASCGDGHGGKTNSALDLNACIGLNSSPGQFILQCQPNGNFAALSGCGSCRLGGSIMTCNCGVIPGLQVNLDDCIVNRFGLLACN